MYELLTPSFYNYSGLEEKMNVKFFDKNLEMFGLKARFVKRIYVWHVFSILKSIPKFSITSIP